MTGQLALALDPCDGLDMSGDPVVELPPPANPCRCTRPLPCPGGDCARCGRSLDLTIPIRALSGE